MKCTLKLQVPAKLIQEAIQWKEVQNHTGEISGIVTVEVSKLINNTPGEFKSYIQ